MNQARNNRSVLFRVFKVADRRTKWTTNKIVGGKEENERAESEWNWLFLKMGKQQICLKLISHLALINQGTGKSSLFRIMELELKIKTKKPPKLKSAFLWNVVLESEMGEKALFLFISYSSALFRVFISWAGNAIII